MTNALEKFRVEQGLTYRELAHALGLTLNKTFRRCQLETLPIGDAAECALRLGVPLHVLCPDKATLASISLGVVKCSEGGRTTPGS